LSGEIDVFASVNEEDSYAKEDQGAANVEPENAHSLASEYREVVDEDSCAEDDDQDPLSLKDSESKTSAGDDCISEPTAADSAHELPGDMPAVPHTFKLISSVHLTLIFFLALSWLFDQVGSGMRT